MYDLYVYGNSNLTTISAQYSDLYNIKSNTIDSYLFHSNIATVDTLTNTIIARMADVYSNNLYNSSIIVCDNDIYTNNLISNSLCSLSDRIILNQNLTLQYPFVTPTENQLGYQIIGTIITNGTSITSGVTYNLSTISLTHGVWNVFGQIAYKCLSVTGTASISYNGFGIANNTTTFGNYRIENYSSQTVAVNNTYADQIVRIQTILTNVNVSLNHNIVFSNCTLITQSAQSFLTATRIA